MLAASLAVSGLATVPSLAEVIEANDLRFTAPAVTVPVKRTISPAEYPAVASASMYRMSSPPPGFVSTPLSTLAFTVTTYLPTSEPTPLA